MIGTIQSCPSPSNSFFNYQRLGKQSLALSCIAASIPDSCKVQNGMMKFGYVAEARAFHQHPTSYHFFKL
jgi:hypothetical protein